MLDLESLFKLSYGMCILTSRKADKVNGCTVNTVFQVTPEPPMVAVSVNRSCLTHEFISDSRVFAVSVLAEDAPMLLIGKFGFRSGRDTDKFEGVNYRIGSTGSPIVMEHTVAFLEVEVVQRLDIETHTLFIGKVVACEMFDASKYPMTYAYYRDVKGGKTPRSAATYIDVNLLKKRKGG